MPVLTNDHTLDALPIKAPAAKRTPDLEIAKSTRNRHAGRELTWGEMLHKAFKDPLTKVDMPPELKKFTVTMAAVNDDGPIIAKYLDQEIFDYIVLESGNDIFFKDSRKFLLDQYSGMLNPQEMPYKCLVSAIEQGKLKFLELLEESHFDILANIISYESGSKLLKLVDLVLKSNILNRYSPQYATNYFRILTSQNWEAAKLFLNDRYPLTLSNDLKNFPANTVKGFLALDKSAKSGAWVHATYRWILTRKPTESREFAQWIYQKIRYQINTEELLSKDGSFAIGICFDAAYFGDIEHAVFFFQEYFKYILKIDQLNSKSESVFDIMEDKMHGMNVRNLESIRALFQETWKLLMSKNGISPDSEYEQRFTQDLKNIMG